jgi:hypothetical protein
MARALRRAQIEQIEQNYGRRRREKTCNLPATGYSTC